MRKRIVWNLGLAVSFLAVILSGVLLLSSCGKSDEETEAEKRQQEWEEQTDEQRLSVYFDLTKESLILKDKLGDTPYITMLRSVRGNMITSGMTKAQALENAEALIVSERALIWYAEENNIKVTDVEVAGYIKNNVINQVREDEAFDKMEEACNKAGITFEDSIWAYEDSYRSAYIISEIPDFNEKLNAEIIEKFKDSSEYVDIAKIIENCKELIDAGETDIDVLKQEDIYFDS